MREFHCTSSWFLIVEMYIKILFIYLFLKQEHIFQPRGRQKQPIQSSKTDRNKTAEKRKDRPQADPATRQFPYQEDQL